MTTNLDESYFRETPYVETRSCEKHGEYESQSPFGKVWSGCPECVREAEHRREAARVAESMAREAAAKLAKIESSGIPVRFRDRTLDSFKAENDGQKAALKFARKYCEDFSKVLQLGRSAVFVGRPGTGKTHLANAIAMTLIEKGHSVLVLTAMRALRAVKDTWSKNSEVSEDEAIWKLVRRDLLILDEVGVQFGSEAEKLILFEVLNERYEACKPTILMSNLMLPELIKIIGERIYDRLRENGGQCIVFDWDSQRGSSQRGGT